MKLKLYVLLAAINLLCVPSLYAQKDSPKTDIPPTWTDGYYRELPNSYVEVVSASASDRMAAREKALRMVVERRNMAAGGRFEVRVMDGDVIVSGNENLTVKARVVDEYARLESGEWLVSLLVQTCKNPMYTYETVGVSDRYPLTVKSFVPGMMQLEKGQTTKGLVMIGAEVAMVGGIVAFEALRSSYVAKINSTHSASARVGFTSSANRCSTVRNVCIAGAAAVYLWSFVDAIASKGPRHLMIADAELTIAPQFGVGYSGLALNMNF